MFYDSDNYSAKKPVLSLRIETDGQRTRFYPKENIDIDKDKSILSQKKDGVTYPEITFMGEYLPQIRIYRGLDAEAYAKMRTQEPSNLPRDFLAEDFSNLKVVLNDLLNKPKTRKVIIEKLRELYETAEDLRANVNSDGDLQLFIHEKGLPNGISAHRMSQGTLHYLYLLSILCHPQPPPLVCIEEPELGLHPDVLNSLGDLLIEASKRTQLIVTTHSDVLISALEPEMVVVCERDEDGTHLKRLDSKRLKKWLEKDALGDLWLMGELGGKRW